MFCSIKDLNGFTLQALNGEIGHAREAYFDDQHWVLRHLVADTGGWLSGRRVLVSPHSIRQISTDTQRVDVSLTRQQIETSPGIDTALPVARQHEISHYDHYGYPYYWAGPGLWGLDVLPMAGEPLILPPLSQLGAAFPDATAMATAAQATVAVDPHLRSSAEVIGYEVQASDGAIGHIADFLFDTRSWQIRFAVVDTHNWLPDRLVLISPAWINDIVWPERQVRVRVGREAVKTSPPYQRGMGLTAAAEEEVQQHYTAWLAASARARERFVEAE